MIPVVATAYKHAIRNALVSENVSNIFRNARICITPGGEPYVKVVQNGFTVDKLPIDVQDAPNTYDAICKIKNSIYKEGSTSL